MIEPLIYCKVCGMALQCIADFQKEFKRRPVVLEIGCADGQGTQRYAGFAERVICVDPMVDGRPDIYSRDQNDLLQEDSSKIVEFERRTKDFPVTLVKGASLWPKTLDEVKQKLGQDRVDVLIIDGCHHPFEAIWGDFEMYYPLVSKGGYVIFDDLYEDCILTAYEKARDQKQMIEHERWGVKRPNILQECAALKKTED